MPYGQCILEIDSFVGIPWIFFWTIISIRSWRQQKDAIVAALHTCGRIDGGSDVKMSKQSPRSFFRQYWILIRIQLGIHHWRANRLKRKRGIPLIVIHTRLKEWRNPLKFVYTLPFSIHTSCCKYEKSKFKIQTWLELVQFCCDNLSQGAHCASCVSQHQNMHMLTWHIILFDKIYLITWQPWMIYVL